MTSGGGVDTGEFETLAFAPQVSSIQTISFISFATSDESDYFPRCLPSLQWHQSCRRASDYFRVTQQPSKPTIFSRRVGKDNVQ